MSKVFIFAGTTEGRKLFELLKENGISCTASVATDYGANLLSGNSNCKVVSGRMSEEEMTSVVKKSGCACVVDATHPFAQEVTRHIKRACSKLGIPYIRLLRSVDEQKNADASILYFDSAASAARYIKDKAGNVFVATGSKDLAAITGTLKDTSRIFVRVLPTEESLLKCMQCGVGEKNIVAMQGPFSVFLNEAMFRETKAKFVITKESGSAGGFEEKIEAAKKCGAVSLVIKNPETKNGGKTKKYYSFSKTVKRLEKILKTKIFFSAQKIVLAGIGPGGMDLVTSEVLSAVQNADAVFGASSVLANPMFNGKKKIASYVFSEVSEYLQNHPECEKPVVVFSGDSGFYSGATLFASECNGKYPYTILPGISSASYLSAKTGNPWHDWKLLSMHGKHCNVEAFARQHKACFVILSGKNDLHELISRLCKAHKNKIIPELKITVAFNLARDDESILSAEISDTNKLKKIRSFKKEGLYSVLLEHVSEQYTKHTPGIRDDLFFRKKIPMTKRDVRLIILSRMALTENSVVYDIGCGTGSVTVESALIAKHGFVYAIDMNQDALELTKKNIAKFGISNAQVIHAKAPDGFCELPKPDCAFVGGSSGNMKDILASLLRLNSRIRIVVACITLETFCLLKQELSSLSATDVDFTQISISRSENRGKYNFVKAENPVWVVSFTGCAKGEA